MKTVLKISSDLLDRLDANAADFEEKVTALLDKPGSQTPSTAPAPKPSSQSTREDRKQYADAAEQLFTTDCALRSEFGSIESLRAYVSAVERGAVQDNELAKRLRVQATHTSPQDNDRSQFAPPVGAMAVNGIQFSSLEDAERYGGQLVAAGYARLTEKS